MALYKFKKVLDIKSMTFLVIKRTFSPGKSSPTKIYFNIQVPLAWGKDISTILGCCAHFDGYHKVLFANYVWTHSNQSGQNSTWEWHEGMIGLGCIKEGGLRPTNKQNISRKIKIRSNIIKIGN